MEKARTGMRLKDPRLAQHCTRTWALPSPRGRPRRRICSCPSSAESGVSTQEMAPSGGSPRAEAPSPSSQQCATPRFLACNTASWTRYSLGTSCDCHLQHPGVHLQIAAVQRMRSAINTTRRSVSTTRGRSSATRPTTCSPTSTTTTRLSRISSPSPWVGRSFVGAPM